MLKARLNYNCFANFPFTAKQKIVKDDKNTIVDGFFNGRVDMSDIEAFDKAGVGGASSAGALIHETVEQHEKSKTGLFPNEWSNSVGLDELSPEYISSHETANNAENRVNGNIKNENEGYFLERDGSKTHQVITPTNDGSIYVEKNQIKP